MGHGTWSNMRFAAHVVGSAVLCTEPVFSWAKCVGMRRFATRADGVCPQVNTRGWYASAPTLSMFRRQRCSADSIGAAEADSKSVPNSIRNRSQTRRGRLGMGHDGALGQNRDSGATSTDVGPKFGRNRPIMGQAGAMSIEFRPMLADSGLHAERSCKPRSETMNEHCNVDTSGRWAAATSSRRPAIVLGPEATKARACLRSWERGS